MAVTLGELARRVGGTVRGRSDLRIERVATPEAAGPHDIVYCAGKKYLDRLGETAAGAVLLSTADAERYGGTVLIVGDPRLAFARIAAWLHPAPAAQPGTHPSAVVDASAHVGAGAAVGPHCTVDADAQLGARVVLGPGCHIGRGVAIGEGCRLVARVVVEHDCRIGRNGIFHPGVVIGSDGFGYAPEGEGWFKIPQLGRVIIGDDVEIGANTTVDRGALGDTVIGNGVKLDNLIQIAHNVRIGDNTAIAAFVGVAGSAVIGRRCTIGGQSGIAGHIEITDDVHITACSLVSSSISRPGVYSASIKAVAADRWRRNAARLYRLDDMARSLRRLEQQLQELLKEQKS